MTRADQPGSTTVVALLSAMIAGPAMVCPGRAAERSTSAASCQRPSLNMRTVAATGAGPAATSACGASPTASPAPTASTDTASTISRRSCIRNAKRWR